MPVSTGYHAAHETLKRWPPVPRAPPTPPSAPSADPLATRMRGSCVAWPVVRSVFVGCSVSYTATTASTVPARRYRRSVSSSSRQLTPPLHRCAMVLSPLSAAASHCRRDTDARNERGRRVPLSRARSSPAVGFQPGDPMVPRPSNGAGPPKLCAEILGICAPRKSRAIFFAVSLSTETAATRRRACGRPWPPPRGHAASRRQR